MNVAGYSISVITPDFLRLDGGAMFGSVPKTLWERRIAADAQNRIRLACRCLLLESKERTILVDTGCGRNWSEKDQLHYQFEATQSLAALRNKVTDVVLTHLHFDHADGIAHFNEQGEFELTFPNATHYLSQSHFNYAQNPNPREKGSFHQLTLDLLQQAKLNLLPDAKDQELFPGITAITADGHTKGLLYLRIGEDLVYASELIPTSHHLQIPYLMGYDRCAETTMKEKEDLLREALARNSRIIFDHDPEIACATIKKVDGKYQVSEMVPIPGENPGEGR